MSQKGILDAKIKKFVDREEMMEDNLKRVFKILHGQCTESLLENMGVDYKYEAIERNQDVIGMRKIIKGVMFKLDRNKEFTHTVWESYVSVF